MFFILFTIEIIWAITILVSYGIFSLVGVVHITFSPTGIIFFPPPAIFTIPVIYLHLLLYLSIKYCRDYQAGFEQEDAIRITVVAVGEPTAPVAAPRTRKDVGGEVSQEVCPFDSLC